MRKYIINWSAISKQFAAKGCVLTFWAEATQRVRFGRGHICQPQCALIKILVGEQVGQTHSGGVVRYIWAELLKGRKRSISQGLSVEYFIKLNQPQHQHWEMQLFFFSLMWDIFLLIVLFWLPSASGVELEHSTTVTLTSPENVPTGSCKTSFTLWGSKICKIMWKSCLIWYLVCPKCTV